jgi:hypothetical protein
MPVSEYPNVPIDHVPGKTTALGRLNVTAPETVLAVIWFAVPETDVIDPDDECALKYASVTAS